MEVNQLLKQFGEMRKMMRSPNKMNKMMRQMGGGMGGKGGMPGLPPGFGSPGGGGLEDLMKNFKGRFPF